MGEILRVSGLSYRYRFRFKFGHQPRDLHLDLNAGTRVPTAETGHLKTPFHPPELIAQTANR